ncbi:transposase [Geomonas anaerohicana]|uniref:Transposase n=1 Tax=Geomonas anaerohicana TaxID=2798583 RepID=A0ABS0YAS2_9BACT|nr:transposase [Geomonas anaerohicana]MBJ6749416.1 transposase [Geomonas anaerohicana]
MPRQARIDIPGALHHIICRGIERREIFCDDHDRDNFLSRLVEITTITSTRCFAWALIPNHFHLLLETGLIPISLLMQKLLTGYATAFNLRHNRHGHLFQNRYKSILCQEETYLLELVRYIHLNPLRAGIISSIEALRDYRYCGHGCLLGKIPDLESWMESRQVLGHFGNSLKESRRAYEAFVLDGVAKGPRADLTGGGLLRSAGGWRELHSAREAGIFLHNDERILGDSDFVDSALQIAEEDLERKSWYRREEVDLQQVIAVVAKAMGMERAEVCAVGKQPQHVQARSLLCYWAVREIGLTETSMAKFLGLSQPAVSQAVERGERLATERGWALRDLLQRNL